MKKYFYKKPLISIHIPKCAGTSFMEVLRHWFGEGYFTHYYDEKNNIPPAKIQLLTGILIKRFRKGICIHGHFNHNRGFGIRDYYPEVKQFITFLRDPFDVHISNYFFVRQQAKCSGPGAFRNGVYFPSANDNITIESFLGRNNISHMKYFFPEEINMSNYKEILERDFVYIGITENLQNSVNILAGKLGFPAVTVTRKNISRWEESIPAGAREKFVENNQLEMAIYEYAQHNFGNNCP